jgi:hypothetical protein
VGIEHQSLIDGCCFMLRHFDGQKIEGYKVASFLALADMSWSCREDMNIARILVPRLTLWCDQENRIAFLNWYLECLVDYGMVDCDIPVASCLDGISAAQRPDGHWGDDKWPELNVHLTIQSLKHLGWAGRL